MDLTEGLTPISSDQCPFVCILEVSHVLHPAHAANKQEHKAEKQMYSK